MKYFKYILSHATKGTLVLDSAPQGWDTDGLKFVRHEKYKTVLRYGITAFKFIKEGKVYVDDVVETLGLDADVSINVYQINPVTNEYDVAFISGILDLSTWESERLYTTCDIIDNTYIAKLVERDTIEYNLFSEFTHDNNPVTPFVAASQVVCTPIEILETANYITSQFLKDTETGNNTESSYPIIVGIVTNDLGADVVLYSDKLYLNTGGGDVNIDIEIRLDFDGVLSANHATGDIAYTWELEHYDSSNVLIISETIMSLNEFIPVEYYYDPYPGATLTSNIFVQRSFTVGPNEYLKLKFKRVYTLTLHINDTFTGDYRNIGYYKIDETIGTGYSTNADCLFPHEAFTRMIQLITGIQVTNNLLYSTITGRTDSEFRIYGSDGEAGLFAITNGQRLRQRAGKAITTTLEDLFASINSWCPIGLWYDWNNSRFEIEEIDHYFNDNRIYDLGEVKDLKISISENYYYNEILTGYAGEIEYEDTNGSCEINTGSKYSLPTQRIKNTYNCQNKYRGDSMGIELTKLKVAISDDYRTDDDNFIIDCERFGGNIRPITPINSTTVIQANSIDIAGIATYYNLRYTPKRILRKHSKLISSCLQFSGLNYIKYNKNKFDNDCNTKLNTEYAYLSEKDDLSCGLPVYSPLYNCRTFDFSHALDYNIIQAIIANPHGYFAFTYNGTSHAGFIIEVGGGSYRKTGNFLLLEKITLPLT